MKENSTQSREMTPPILLAHCPGEGGHFWPILNRRWFGEEKRTGRSMVNVTKWCPDHQEEKSKEVSRKISEAMMQRHFAWDKLPLPETRQCFSKNPRSHPPKAVLPQRKFYRRHSQARKDGSVPVVLDSHCKDCRRQQAEERRVKALQENPAQLRLQRKMWQRTAREKARKARAKIKGQKDPKYPVLPLRDWLNSNLNGYTPEELCEDIKVDPATVRRILSDGRKKWVQAWVVEEIGAALGRPSLSIELYPPEDEP